MCMTEKFNECFAEKFEDLDLHFNNHAQSQLHNQTTSIVVLLHLVHKLFVIIIYILLLGYRKSWSN